MSHPSMEAKQVKEVKNGRRKTHLEGHAERMKKFTKCDGLEKDLEKFVPRESKLLADDVMKERIAEDDRALLECATIWGRDISTEDQTFGFLRDIEAASSRATNSGAHPFALPLPTPQTSSSLGDNTNNEKRPGDETVLSGSKRIKSVTGLRDLSTKEMDKKPGLVKKSQPG
ncbi:hypothetical protein J4E80_005312 [Alternaria sp. BMP 0032]|nr:hypothetical protein J4E80_005312 [Alternaria sp. BMP 0032]